MTMPTAPAGQAGLTARALLLGDGPGDDLGRLRQLLSEHDVVRSCGGDLTWLTTPGLAAAEEQLASVTAGLLDLNLGDLLIGGWRTRARLLAAARDTRRVPGRQDVVQLASHQLTSTHYPAVEVLIDDVRVHTFRFCLTVTFDLDVAALLVRDGRLTGLKGGDGTVTGTLSLDQPGGDVDLVRRRQDIDPHLILTFGPGLPLLPAEPGHPAADHAPADRPGRPG